MPRKKIIIPAFRREGTKADLRPASGDLDTATLHDVVAEAHRNRELVHLTLRLTAEDMAAARRIADKKGIGYQSYIELLLHEALQKEVGRQMRIRK